MAANGCTNRESRVAHAHPLQLTIAKGSGQSVARLLVVAFTRTKVHASLKAGVQRAA
jgi:hypothetical protein